MYDINICKSVTYILKVKETTFMKILNIFFTYKNLNISVILLYDFKLLKNEECEELL